MLHLSTTSQLLLGTAGSILQSIARISYGRNGAQLTIAYDAIIPATL